MRALGVSLSLVVLVSLWTAPRPEASPAARDSRVSAVGGVAEILPGEHAARQWREHLRVLDRAGVRLPPARALLDESRFPPGLRPVPGAEGDGRRGVAWAPDAGALVVPREVSVVVSGALDAVGSPYAADGDGPESFSCDGLVHALYRRVGFDVPGSAAAQWATGRSVAVEDAAPGDLVVLGSDRYGVQSVGIVVGEDEVVVADALSAAVVVAALPSHDAVLDVVRPSLGTRSSRPMPPGSGSLSWHCGGIRPLKGGAGGADGAGGGGPDPARRGWAGYPNGLIPTGVLCPLDEEPHALRCDAARDLVSLSEAYSGALGEPLCLTDSYRTLEMQLGLHRRKPELSATPGTSTHGWGLAVDLCGGVETFGTDEHRWMRAHARHFGWLLPRWAQEGSPREEPWHWEYVGR
ncbi:D-alanyl-D-alanine carboxypeptidase family protein [Saccharomonospora xinjiangensis]|uniref:D-alanyl-D-alanine carboxypeptidase family protein n=1 Tax=Saccharomonospora xinjiangensis TaxID=75294 RepID=UPI00106FB9E7|nr:D-alanyl-D-alanine carboxypeptidase family protein [Saccharomonospora xinjiangensis]QBQ59543.1 putative endopeptidase precursor [Saccharomonospora xinjiangensis]